MERVLSENDIAETMSIKLGLELSYCIGFLEGRCSVMTSRTKRAFIILQRTLKNVTFYPCHNHAINFSISMKEVV